MNEFIRYYFLPYKQKKDVMFTASFVILLMLESYTYLSMYSINSKIKLVIIIFQFMMLIQMFKGKFEQYFEQNTFIASFLICCIFIVSKILHRDSSGYYYELLIQFLCAYCIVTVFDLNDFCKYYVKAMRFLAIYSLILTYCIIFIPSIRSFFPTIRHYGGNYENGYITFINAIFCNVYVPTYQPQYRNFGLYREPGVYSIYLFLAMILDVFVLNKKESIIWLLIWNIVILSTFSSAGIVVIAVIDIYYLFNKDVPKKVKFWGVLVIVLIVILAFTFEPVRNLFEESMNKYSGGGSASSRTGSFIGSIMSWIHSPIFGWGYTGVISGKGSIYIKQYTNDYTNTVFLCFAMFGVLYGLLYNCGLFTFFKKCKIPPILIILIYILLCTQEMLKSTVLFCFIIYGFSSIDYISEVGEKNEVRRLL